jgi:hypothetical protein
MPHLRPLNVGDIEYIFIPKEREANTFPWLPPTGFANHGLNLVRTLPKNVLQLNDPFVFYGNSKAVQSLTPHRLSVFYPDSIDFMIKTNPYIDSIKFFLVHSEIPQLGKILDKVRKEYPLIFWSYTDFEKSPLKDHESTFVKDDKQFIERLKERKTEIENILFKAFPKQRINFEVNLPLTDLHIQLNEENYFKASHSNYCTLNQMIGNDWASTKVQPESEETILEHSKSAHKKPPDNLDRFDVLLKQVKNIQELEIIICDDRNIQFPNKEYDYLSPLVIVLPFNFPSIKKAYDSYGPNIEKLSRALSQEQSMNYLFYTVAHESVTPEEVSMYAQFISLRTQYLDSLAYLHASFTYSAIIRFPVLGNSIKKHLSFFKPETINDTKFKNSKHLINVFGKKLAKLILPPSRADKVFGVPNQLVAITDLPIEWMLYKDLNLCLTYDITRIPELPYGGIMASYALNSHTEFKIKKDILKRVLVISGASSTPGVDEEFKHYFNSIEKLGNELGYHTARCSSKQEVIEQVRQHQPDILIFDCHGDFDEDKLSSNLVINGEVLTPTEIATNKISAPIVFLSACHTNPTYGYVNKLADAFFEAGCVAITATYFPISIQAGTNLYIRILNNLKTAAISPVHKNWLEFVCHNIRTSYLKEVIYQCELSIELAPFPEKAKAYFKKELKKLNMDSSLYLMRQNHRERVFKEFYSRLLKIMPKKIFNPNSVVPEHCFYTNMGRGDLIRFEVWEDEFNRQNAINR